MKGIITEFIFPETVIITDEWRAYSAASRHCSPTIHLTIHYWRNFVDPVSPIVHTQNIECFFRKSNVHWGQEKVYRRTRLAFIHSNTSWNAKSREEEVFEDYNLIYAQRFWPTSFWFDAPPFARSFGSFFYRTNILFLLIIRTHSLYTVRTWSSSSVESLWMICIYNDRFFRYFGFLPFFSFDTNYFNGFSSYLW